MKHLIHCNGFGRIVDVPRETTSDGYGEMQANFAKAAGGVDSYADMIRLYDDQVAHGVYYAWGLASADGAWFNFIALPDTTDDMLAAAKAKIRRDQDVVSMRVTRIKRMI